MTFISKDSQTKFCLQSVRLCSSARVWMLCIFPPFMLKTGNLWAKHVGTVVTEYVCRFPAGVSHRHKESTLSSALERYPLFGNHIQIHIPAGKIWYSYLSCCLILSRPLPTDHLQLFVIPFLNHVQQVKQYHLCRELCQFKPVWDCHPLDKRH